MKTYIWNNDFFGNYDVFIVMNYEEVEELIRYYKTDEIISTSFDGKEFYYLIDRINNIITPMMQISIAFGGQYNATPPYSEEINDFNFNVEDYTLKHFDGKLSSFSKPDDLAIKGKEYFSKLLNVLDDEAEIYDYSNEAMKVLKEYGDKHNLELLSFYKEKNSKVWYVDVKDSIGVHLFSFDKKKIYSVFPYGQDDGMTEEEKEIFRKENPTLAELKGI